ncbi:MAG: flagellar motor switch protein FliG [Treponema sp.]|nr:flagellar motor switch protein FliG [Treponema sp.]
MNLNDYRLNAYNRTKRTPAKETQKTAGGEAEDQKAVVYTPVFEKISRKQEKIPAEKKSPEEIQRAFRQSLDRAIAAQKNVSTRAPAQKQSPGPIEGDGGPKYSTKKNLAKGSDIKSAEDKKAEETARLAAKNGAWFEKKNTTEEEVKEAASRLTSGGLIMVPEQEKKEGEKESIYRRVAKFLVVIGIDEAAKILPHLTEEQTEKIIPEIASIRYVSPEDASAVIEEFKSLLTKARESGGVDTARTILTKAYGSQKANEVLAKVVKHPNGKPFDYLSDADAERIGILLDGESAAVQALVLSQIEPQKAAKIINRMDTDVKTDVIMRLAKMQSVSPEVLENLSKSLHDKMMTQNTANSRNLDGRTALAQILKRMDPSAEYSIIATLSEENPELGADLRRRLFTEDDVIGCDDRYMQKKLHDMTDADLVILLRGKNDEFREKIFKNVSKNRAQIIADEERLKEYILRSDSERITSQFYADLRRAWEVGELVIKGRDDEEYV